MGKSIKTLRLTFINGISALFSSEGSLNQHIKLKHPEFYAQMSANNQNIAGLSKQGSQINGDDSRSLESDSDRDNLSEEEESYSAPAKGHHIKSEK